MKMEFSWNSNTKCAEKPQSFISMHPFFWCSLFFKNISAPSLEPRNWYKQCCLPPLSFKISLKGTSFDISLNSLEFYLSPKCSLNFLWLVSPCVGKKFQFMAFTFLENAMILCIFTYAPVPHSKLQVEFFENLFPP